MKPFTREREIYKRNGRVPFSWIESLIPWCFIVLYAVMMTATLVKS